MTVHIVGAGLAGLACAITVAQAKQLVILYEKTQQCGGRCRSFYDGKMNKIIDNGTHLIIGANTQTLRYIDYLSSRHHFITIKPSSFPFFDLTSGDGWTLRPNKGKLPWWLTKPKQRVFESHFIDYLSAYYLLYGKSKHSMTVADCLNGSLMQRLWHPLTEAALNVEPKDAPASLFARVVRDSLMRGERACRPYIARHNLSAALIDPALTKILTQGGIVRLGAWLQAISFFSQKYHEPCIQLHFKNETIKIQKEDDVVLALPPWVIKSLLPDLQVPKVFQSIINVHFLLEKSVKLPGGGPFLAAIGETTQWLFIRNNILSVTVSAANTLVSQDSITIAKTVWENCAKVLSLPITPVPLKRVIKERRATTLSQNSNLPSLSPLPGITLAGDWTYSNLPTTIEAAISSGIRAATQILSARKL